MTDPNRSEQPSSGAIDALLPAGMANVAERAGGEKIRKDAPSLLVLAELHLDDGARMGVSLLASAQRLTELGFVQAFFLGVLDNTLLCLGVWLTYSGRSTTDRIVALVYWFIYLRPLRR